MKHAMDDNGAKKVSELAAGKIQFLDNFIPAIRDGEYEIQVDHKLTGGTANAGHSLPGGNAGKTFSATQRFTVRGPRFTLPGADVHSRSPPGGHQGRFEEDLPHIVLNKRGLPWERKLDPKKAESTVPWMALLLLRADELLVMPPEKIKLGHEGVPAPKGLANPTRSGKFLINQVISPMVALEENQGSNQGHIQGPRIAHLSTDEQAVAGSLVCRAIDISTTVFETVVPKLSEAAHLAHVRQVDTGDKEILGIKDDGWFSVVVAKRFPRHDSRFPPMPSHPTGSTPYVAHLVSLEGFEDFLGDDAPSWSPAIKKVRMFSLVSWTFNVLPEPAQSFADLACGLINPLQQFSTKTAAPTENPETTGLQDLMLRMPTVGQTSQPNAMASERLHQGYTPLSYRSRPGEATFAWYRGPFAPTQVPFVMDATGDEEGRIPAPTRAAEAYIYDPDCGVFDLSYGVAFMTGRAMALADSSFAQNVMNWRRRMHQILDRIQARISSEHLPGLTGKSGDLSHKAAHELEELLEEKLVTRSFVANLVQGLGEKIVSKGNISPPRPFPWEPPGDSTDRTIRQSLAKLLDQPEIKALLSSLPEALPEDIVAWLAPRLLLEGIPFHNLVPSARMLPVESIRFFYLDQNWLSCFIDGAFSVGSHSSRDTALYELLRGPLFEWTYETVHRLRDRLRGEQGIESNRKQKGSLNFSGFLLRSALVSGWPGLEVKAFSQARGKGRQIKLLRMQRLSPDVLLLLFPEIPKSVQLNQPGESLGFGFEIIRAGGCTGNSQRNKTNADKDPDKDVFELRHITGPQTGHPLLDNKANPITVQLAWKDRHLAVLDVNEMIRLMAVKLGIEASQIGPAAFAMNMVKVPEQMLFEHPG